MAFIRVLLTAVALGLLCSEARAQSPELDLDELRWETEIWMAEYEPWRVQRDFNSEFEEERHTYIRSLSYSQRQKVTKPELTFLELPLPPDGLVFYCETVDQTVSESEMMVKACELYADLRNYLDHGRRSRILAARLLQDQPAPKTKFWERFQIDLMHAHAEIGYSNIWGLVGLHYSIPVPGAKRLEIYPAPGLMLLNLPNVSSQWNLTPAFTWGFGFRCCEIPLGEKKLVVFLNISRVWNASDTSQVVNLAGLSVSWRNRY